MKMSKNDKRKIKKNAKKKKFESFMNILDSKIEILVIRAAMGAFSIFLPAVIERQIINELH